MDENDRRVLYLAMSAIAGAITSLSFMPWKTMRWSEILMTVFVGCGFATFGVPYLVGDKLGIDMENLRAACFFTYLGATGANAFLPMLIRNGLSWLKRMTGPEKGGEA